MQILISRDYLFQVTLASTRWIYHINSYDGFDLLNLFSDHNLHMILLCFILLRQIKITRTILKETLYRTYLVLKELSPKITLRDSFQTIYFILRELAWKLIWILTLKASCKKYFGLTTLPPFILGQAFAREIPFDTDSLFWICNNSATGHICYNKSLFSGEMVPFIYIVGAATGTTEPTLMRMVVLCTNDNNK